MNVQNSNMTQLSEKFKRTVNNVTMAMPHAGVFGAARDPRNGIVQPQDLSVSLPFDHSQEQKVVDEAPC